MPRPTKQSWSEKSAVELLGSLFASKQRDIVVGIGDDAAVVRAPREPLVLTIDACVEGVHFDRRWLSLEDVGYRACQAAVSDLAAMGARPVAALSNVCLPRSAGRKELAAIGRGQAEALRELGCPMVGGNLTRGPVVAVDTAVIGSADARGSLLRSGGRPGQELWLVGDVGLAGAGLRCLQQGLSARGAARACIERWRRPKALLRAGRALVGRATACCDVSDGLARDALHLAEASGVRVVIEETALSGVLPAALVETAALLGVPALGFALEGGEDYALLCAGPAARRPKSAKRIGRIERVKRDASAGAFLERARGKPVRLAGGFDHLAR